MTNEFNCLACGAPVEPEAGRDRMACPYCHTQLTIPLELRWKTVPSNETSHNEPWATFAQATPSAKTSEQEVADFIRKAQPVATRAWNFYALSSRVARLAPGCIIALLTACGVMCLLFTALIAFLRR